MDIDAGPYRCTFLTDGRVGPIPASDVVLDDALAARMGAYDTPMNIVLLRSEEETIVVDGGMGRGERTGLLVDQLAAAGVSTTDVTRVLVTHMHGDHVNGLLTEGVPTFPRARVHIPPADIRWVRDVGRPTTALADTLDGAGLLAGIDDLPTGVAAMPMPGHTPGHTAYGAGALIVGGDVLLLPDHFGDPSIRVSFDDDAVRAEASRRDFLSRAATDASVVSLYHLEAPAGHVVADGDAWAFRTTG